MIREKQDAIDFANQGLLLDLIPVIDDFDRAIKSTEVSKDFISFHEGISMIEKRLSSQLENKWGLKRFDSAGEAFDPNRHEAIMMDKSAEISEPVVQEDFLKGYTLKDRVIRAAKVKVLMPEENTPSGEGETQTETPGTGG
jgi:molecular chaperone GrpE